MNHQDFEQGRSIPEMLNDLREREIIAEIEGPRQAAFQAFDCPYCGREDGLQHCDRLSAREMMDDPDKYDWPARWWIADSDDTMGRTHDLYYACGECREPDTRGMMEIPREFVQLWAVTPCGCDECKGAK
jgi:hypothetical protein